MANFQPIVAFPQIMSWMSHRQHRRVHGLRNELCHLAFRRQHIAVRYTRYEARSIPSSPFGKHRIFHAWHLTGCCRRKRRRGHRTSHALSPHGMPSVRATRLRKPSLEKGLEERRHTCQIGHRVRRASRLLDTIVLARVAGERWTCTLARRRPRLCDT